MTANNRNHLEERFAVSRETAERLSLYVDTLLKWQQRVNLIGPSTQEDIWQRHIADSLHLLSYIENRQARLIDLGSGAGLPGLVLAIAGMPDVTLVESDAKKITFLKEAARLTHTPVTVVRSRIEEMKPVRCDIVTARALAPLNRLLGWASAFVGERTICLFPKGKNYSMELDDARKEWEFDCKILPPAQGSDGSVLKISLLRLKHP